MEAVVVVVVVVVVVGLKVMLGANFTILQGPQFYEARFHIKILFAIVPLYKFDENMLG